MNTRACTRLLVLCREQMVVSVLYSSANGARRGPERVAGVSQLAEGGMSRDHGA